MSPTNPPAKSLRILFCNYEYPPLGGGGGVINAMLAEELAKRHEVTVLTSQGLDLPAERVENGVRVIRVPVFFRKQQTVASLVSMFFYIPQGIRAGRRLLGEQHYDVINTHFVLPTGPVGDHLARYGKIPNVLSLHGGDLYDPSKFMSPHRHLVLRSAAKHLLRRSDCVVGQSTNTLDNMHRFYTPEISGQRIPLGIVRPPPGTADRERYGCSPDELLFVTVGRLVPRKAVDQLISIMPALQAYNARLLVIGSGPEEPALLAKAVELGIQDRVLLLGQVEESEKFRILRMCDVYASTSQHEGFGLVFLEAMACGLPVVCYAHGGQTDFLADNTSGYLVPLNDQNAFTNRCATVAGDKQLRLKFGSNNLDTVEEYFIDRCAKRYEDVFLDVIARHKHNTRPC
jgi:glycosyltransferase involved in cell wall biosynthesis